jgi:hypothetical protein
MDADVEKWVDTCHGCQVTVQASPPEPVIHTELASRLWEVISCDFMGPLPSKHHLLVVMDYYSYFPLVEVVTYTTAEVLIQHLKKISGRFTFLSWTMDQQLWTIVRRSSY